MITYKELRWNNWVLVDGLPYTVNGEFLAQIDKKNCTWRKSVEFLKLTREILEKAGFVTDDGELFYTLFMGLYYNEDLGDFRYRKVDGSAVSVTTLHQLQNLYFALTGEELNIQL